MKTLSSAYAAHIAGPVTTLATCWKITKKNGDVIMGTTHDRNIVVAQTNVGIEIPSGSDFTLNGVYLSSSGITSSNIRSGSDFSADNVEIGGALTTLDIDISIPDIKAGLYDGAQITTFRVNWQDPDDFQDVMRHGFFGRIEWNSDFAYKTEVMGLKEILNQQIGRTCGETCDVEEFGDARCKKDLGPLTATGTVTAVTNSKLFNSSLIFGVGAPSPSAGYFRLGKLTWLTGANAGYTGQVKDDDVGSVLGHLEMYEPFPNVVTNGDTFTLTPGCDRRYQTCLEVHENIINFRGPGVFIPGFDQIIRAP